MLLLNNFIAIANKIIPNTFFNIAIPAAPKILSNVAVNFKTIQTTTKFIIMATKILISSNSALRDIKEVMVPAPAIIGKANGTTDATFVEVFPLSLKMSTPNIISNAMKNNTKEPATANSLMPTPISPKILSPTNRNPTQNKQCNSSSS